MPDSRTNRVENVWAHHKLEVWKISIDLVADVYRLTGAFPSDERFGLVSQMRRTSVSIASNIAEGAGKGGQKEFSRYLLIFPRRVVRIGNTVENRSSTGSCLGNPRKYRPTRAERVRAAERLAETFEELTL